MHKLHVHCSAAFKGYLKTVLQCCIQIQLKILTKSDI